MELAQQPVLLDFSNKQAKISVYNANLVALLVLMLRSAQFVTMDSN